MIAARRVIKRIAIQPGAVEVSDPHVIGAANGESVKF